MKSLHLVSVLLIAASGAMAQQYVISTIAGLPDVTGYFGDATTGIDAPCGCSGLATAGEFANPIRITEDAQGNLYVVDSLNNVVRQVANTGIINTYAGSNTIGFIGDGSGATSADLNGVQGVGTDLAGNLYIADTSNSVVRRVDPKGVISTFAGDVTSITGTNEFAQLGYNGDGGVATKAQLARPSGVTADGAGNVYIVDYGNLTVRKVTPDQKIATIAGNAKFGYSGDGGPATQASFGSPYAIAVDPAGNVFVLDTSFNNIREVTTNGNIQTVATNVNTEAIAVDSADNIYYPDLSTNTVQKITPSGANITIAGNGTPGYSGDGGIATFAQLNQPQGIWVDGSGNVFVVDTGNQIVRELTPTSPSFSIGSVVNGASNQVSQIAPGEIVILYGTGLGPSAAVTNAAVNGAYGTLLAGTQVNIDGRVAPILYTSATQVAAVVPFEEVPFNNAEITVFYQGQQTTTVPVPIAYTAPGIFTLNGAGSGQAAAINTDGTVNGAAHPVHIGGYLSLYVTGTGATSPASVDGALATGSLAAGTLPQAQQTVKVSVGGQPATVIYAGAAPGQISGLTQINIQIPSGVQPGNAVPVVVQAGTALSQTATIAVAQ